MNKKLLFVLGIISGIVFVIIIQGQPTNLGATVRGANVFSSANQTAVTVATSSTSILARDTNRLYVMLCNDDGTNYVDISFDSSANATTGFKLTAGECYEIDGDNLYLGAIYGIANTSSSVVTTLYK